MRFDDKKVVLTGGSAGIGYECARKLQALGAHVTVIDRNPCDLPGLTFIEGDLSSRAGVAAVLDALNGPFHALLNVAGLPPRAGNEPLLYAVNFQALRHLTLGLLDRIHDGGRIVSVASLAGAAWVQNLAQVQALLAMDHDASGADIHAALALPPARAYALTKEAVIAWTIQQTALGLPRGLAMNTVSPAAVNTGIIDDFKTAFGPKVAENLAKVGRASEAHEVADLILFLASKASAWIKGSDVVIDGGISAATKAATFGLTSEQS